MNVWLLHLNLAVGWTWILVGFFSGMLLGMKFHVEEWLGGYASFKRRLYRLAHISFFGLALINLLFYFSVRLVPLNGAGVRTASIGFILGALTMPLCCVITANAPRLRMAFAVPVTSLIAAGAVTLWEIVK